MFIIKGHILFFNWKILIKWGKNPQRSVRAEPREPSPPQPGAEAGPKRLPPSVTRSCTAQERLPAGSRWHLRCESSPSPWESYAENYRTKQNTTHGVKRGKTATSNIHVVWPRIPDPCRTWMGGSKNISHIFIFPFWTVLFTGKRLCGPHFEIRGVLLLFEGRASP